MTGQADETVEPRGTGEAGAGDSRTVTSAELFGAAREVLIRHDGDTYRLRITRAGKLILNK